MTYLEKVLKLRDLLLGSNFCVVLTGAGVSVPSGIPDFRSASGVYAKYGQEIFDINVFKSNPERFYEFAKQELFKMLDVQPNEVHNLIAILEQKGIVKGLITQNIDDLHRRAGSRQIAQIHGNVRVWNCLRCNKRYELYDESQKSELLVNKFRCSCGGLTKPDIH
ncbi:MAG: hypothetical protein N2Z58_09360 [Fervidobacterium sp.]|nr:hypothetical protein [Fervidobacterium sp.]